ncbi:MAG: sterol desaturase family protein, partial [Pseudomonadota bacterium]
PLPRRAKFAFHLEQWLGGPLRLIEWAGAILITRPIQFLLARLDPLAQRIEGTWLKKFLEYTLFPMTLIVTLAIGFHFAESGVTIASLSALALLPVVYGLLFAPLERLLPFSRNWLDGENDLSVDLMMFFSGALWGGFAKYLLSVVFFVELVYWLEPYGHSIWPTALPGVAQVFLFLLIKDFFRYWFHRWLHEVPFLWRFHAVHHSSDRLYWLNGVRSHPVEVIAPTLIWSIPLALVQPPAEIVMVSLLMSLSIGIFQHANIKLRLGFWEYIFSIGDNHRYHHYPVKGIGDSNYGGELIVWDILFGTFHNPRGETPSDKIGIGAYPDYPQTMAGMMLAPFIPNQRVLGGEDGDLDAADRSNLEGLHDRVAPQSSGG